MMTCGSHRIRDIKPTQSPLVSIVIPCFNSERFVAEAVESALGQTYPRTEVIVVDDGSTDGSLAVLENFGSRVKLIRQPKGGAPRARNAGVEAAQGDFIQFLDADDLLLPGKVEACVKRFSPAFDVVFTDYFDEDVERRHGRSRLKQFLRPLQRRPPAWDSSEPLVSALRVSVGTNSALLRKAILVSAGGWDEELANNQDIELFFRLALRGALFERVPKKLVRVRSHDSPTRIRLRPDAFRGVLLATRKMDQQAANANVLHGEVSQLLSNRYATYGRLAYQSGDRDLARQAFTRARQLSVRPRPTSYPLYNTVSYALGLERTARLSLWFMRRCGVRFLLALGI